MTTPRAHPRSPARSSALQGRPETCRRDQIGSRSAHGAPAQFAIEILRKTAQLVRCFLMTSDDLRRLPANLKTTIIAPCLPGRCRDERAESVLADRLKAVTGHGPAGRLPGMDPAARHVAVLGHGNLGMTPLVAPIRADRPSSSISVATACGSCG